MANTPKNNDPKELKLCDIPFGGPKMAKIGVFVVGSTDFRIMKFGFLARVC